eukprot:m.129701 g.129701  ORF g.129701 m.129701 type:complete len:295 (-) comp16767_c0_seq4:1687-2571(-)
MAAGQLEPADAATYSVYVRPDTALDLCKLYHFDGQSSHSSSSVSLAPDASATFSSLRALVQRAVLGRMDPTSFPDHKHFLTVVFTTFYWFTSPDDLCGALLDVFYEAETFLAEIKAGSSAAESIFSVVDVKVAVCNVLQIWWTEHDRPRAIRDTIMSFEEEIQGDPDFLALPSVPEIVKPLPRQHTLYQARTSAQKDDETDLLSQLPSAVSEQFCLLDFYNYRVITPEEIQCHLESNSSSSVRPKLYTRPQLQPNLPKLQSACLQPTRSQSTSLVTATTRVPAGATHAADGKGY